jgi:formylmethanofuran dehydrogenase subunit A
VYKGGELVARDGAVMKDVCGRAYSVAPGFDTGIEAELREHFKEMYTVSFDNYSVLAGHDLPTEKVACT